ncbi:MAG TPA: serpin family protein [Capsulimonadaceae bacterium]
MRVEPRVVTAANDFGFNLLRGLVTKDPSANTFISPTSIHMALAMAYNGAGGATKSEMAKAMGVDGIDVGALNADYSELQQELTPKVTDSVEFTLANALWVSTRFTIRQPFASAVSKSYSAEVRKLDFTNSGAVQTINSWVNDKTHGKIRDISTRLSPDTALCLSDAIYFKGKWKDPFQPRDTRLLPFSTTSGSTITVPMMSRKALFRYVAKQDYQAIELPYRGDEYAMIVVLPAVGMRTSQLTGVLSARGWADMRASMIEMEGAFSMPKTKCEGSYGLIPSLQQLGIRRAFEKPADFPAMINEQVPLWVNAIDHKTTVAIDEQGTEAAAVTDETIVALSMAEFTMIVNRPYLVAIEHKATGALLFVGEINNPPVVTDNFVSAVFGPIRYYLYVVLTIALLVVYWRRSAIRRNKATRLRESAS